MRRGGEEGRGGRKTASVNQKRGQSSEIQTSAAFMSMNRDSTPAF